MTVRVYQMPSTRLVLWISLGLLVSGLGLSTLARSHARKLPSWAWENPVTVLPARIKAAKTFTVNSDLTGKISSISVAAGDQVQQGQSLAFLDSDQLRDELATAERRLRFAVSRVAMAKSGVSHSAQAVQREQLDTATRNKKGARERLSTFSLADADRMYQEAKRRRLQIKALVDQQLATGSELQDAVAYEEAQFNNLKSAREHFSRLKQETDQAESQLRLVRMNAPSAHGNSAEILAAELELEEARETIRAAKQRFAARNVLAPEAGTVLRVLVHPGDRIGAGSPVLQIADLSHLNFEVPVTAKIAEQIRPGSTVTLRIPTDPPRREPATVSAVTLLADQENPSYVIQITIPNPMPTEILAGLQGAVEFPHGGTIWKRAPSF